MQIITPPRGTPAKADIRRPTPTVIFSTESRLNQRGIRARAKSWGWAWITLPGEKQGTHYVSMGMPERLHAVGPDGRPLRQHQRCQWCGYAEASTIGPTPTHCPQCKMDSIALLGLAMLEQGINLGWRMPELRERWGRLSLEEKGGYMPDRQLNKRVKREQARTLNIRGT